MIKDKGAANMHDQTAPMISERIHPPKYVIKRESQPQQRLVLAKMKACKYPLEFAQTESAIARIIYQCKVVPVDKTVFQNRQKRHQREQCDEHRNRIKELRWKKLWQSYFLRRFRRAVPAGLDLTGRESSCGSCILPVRAT